MYHYRISVNKILQQTHEKTKNKNKILLQLSTEIHKFNE
jgi:hypothetical protein